MLAKQKILTIVTLFLILTLGNIFPGAFTSASANTDLQDIPQIPHEFYRAKVVKILEEGKTETAGIPQPYQKIIIELLTGPEKSQKFEIIYGDFFAIQESQKVKKGEIVVVGRTTPEKNSAGSADPTKANDPANSTGSTRTTDSADPDASADSNDPANSIDSTATTPTPNYYITEKYRIPGLAWAIIIFLAIAIAFGRKNAFFAIIGLAVTIAILIKIVMPLIIKGVNPLLATLMGSLLITIFSLYLAHGFRKRTTIAAFSMVISIAIAVGMAEFFAILAKLSGAATEDVYFLQSGPFAGLDLKGLLLSGMIFGALGVLDDVATAQSAAVEELKKANPSLTFSRLYHHGMEIGREHISSLINTLFLAYAGAGLPLMLMMATPMDGTSLWITLNNEILAEEIIRTLVGSISLIFAVPITTFIAAKWNARSEA